jgi:hypothetical protein
MTVRWPYANSVLSWGRYPIAPAKEPPDHAPGQHTKPARASGLGEDSAERADLDVVAHQLQLQDHQTGSTQVVGVHEKPRGLQVESRLGAEPADNGHPTIVPLVIDENLTSQVMVEVDLIPRLGEAGEALFRRPRPHCVGILGNEDLAADGVIVKEQDPAPSLRSLVH